MREVLKEILALAGFPCEALESVEAALDYLRRNHCHLILTDIRLPGLDGFDLLRHVRECCPETAVIYDHRRLRCSGGSQLPHRWRLPLHHQTVSGAGASLDFSPTEGSQAASKRLSNSGGASAIDCW